MNFSLGDYSNLDQAQRRSGVQKQDSIGSLLNVEAEDGIGFKDLLNMHLDGDISEEDTQAFVSALNSRIENFINNVVSKTGGTANTDFLI